MLKETEIKVNITTRNVSMYNKLGYVCKIGDKIYINICDLPDNSHYKITAICKLCGSENYIKYNKYRENKNRHNYYGCKQCSNKKAIKTNIELYGEINYMCTDEAKERVSKTMFEKYGFKTNLLNDDYINLNKKIMNDKYGVDYPMQSKKIVNKYKETMVNRYGVDSYSKTKEFKNCIDNWSVNIVKKLNLYNISNYKINHDDNNVSIFCDKCDKYYEISSKNLYQRKIIQKSETCTNCNPLSKSFSVQEKELYNFIKNYYDGDIIVNDRKTIGYELDIYLPDINLAFEYNGIYWHSDLFKDKNYHLDKTNICLENGIELIHIYENYWLNNRLVIESRIINLLSSNSNKIYAYDCDINITSSKISSEFIELNHLKSFIGGRIELGLYYKGELVSLMIFRKIKSNWELIRFCDRLYTDVIGSYFKLFKFFIDNYLEYGYVIGYSDRSWYSKNKNIYINLGFNVVYMTNVNYNKFNRIYDSGDIFFKYTCIE